MLVTVATEAVTGGAATISKVVVFVQLPFPWSVRVTVYVPVANGLIVALTEPAAAVVLPFAAPAHAIP